MKTVTATQALEDRKEVDKFARQYSAYVSTSRQYRRRVAPPVRWDDPRSVYEYQFLTDTYEEPFVELHMPAASFDHLIRLNEVQDQDAYKVQQAMDVLKQHRIDERVRDDNPAVQKAWLKYLMLLELARK